MVTIRATWTLRGLCSLQVSSFNQLFHFFFDNRRGRRCPSTAMARNSGQLHFKIVLLGEGCVGKTSLVLRYVEDKFNEKHFSTIQVNFHTECLVRCYDIIFLLQASFLTKKINLEGQRITLAIWDTVRFRFLVNS